MALRVLLADESSTIKKVMQVALDEFGVEVKSVPVGLDVVQSAIEFKPDIIFADILLAKKNGYEVSLAIKENSLLSQLPVVLMWSGFMDLDHQKFALSKANSSLEKPFDSDSLKKLVLDLVPKLSGNKIAPFTQFSERPDFTQDWDEEFKSVSLKDLSDLSSQTQPNFQMPPDASEPTQNSMASSATIQWEPQSLQPTEAVETLVPDFDVTNTNVLLSNSQQEVSIESFTSAGVRSSPRMGNSSVNNSPSIDPLRMEEILRSEARDVIEKIAWNLLPGIVDRVVKEEVQKILKEAEKLEL